MGRPASATAADENTAAERSSDGQMSLAEGRLGARPSRYLIEHVNKVQLDDELVSIDEYVLTDIAHGVMLTQEGIFDLDHGRDIVRALLELRAGDTVGLLGSDPAVGTLGLQIEQYLRERCGPRGRDIQRARSRIDQKATNWRLVNRAHLARVLHELLSLGSVLLTAADQHRGVLIPGYTHLQHAQPTTVDHYLNAHYWALSRNLGRLFDAYDRLNVSPLGGAANSGTSWPINRATTASYLGFDRPIPNARDAGFAALDMGAELASVLGLTLSAISRLAADLNYWASTEVNLIRIDPSLCGTSSMMPQKRNPMVLERIRGLAGTAVGWAASQLGVMHTGTSTDVDQSYVHNLIPGYCGETVGAIALLREVVASVEIDTTAMRASAGRHWSTASALADELVRTHRMSFRDAHESVAHFVAAHERAGVTDGNLRVDLAEAPLNTYPSERLREILDPESFVATRISSGGTGERARETLAASARADLAVQEDRLVQRRTRVEEGRDRLLRDARALVGDGEVNGCADHASPLPQ